MRKINKIIIHCSDSEWGTVDDIDAWHKERGWDEVGYNWVITNGRLKSGNYQETWDGKIQAGRDIEKIGAHCKGENKDSVGICLIGKHHFTANQFYKSLPYLLSTLIKEYDLSVADIHGHYEYNDNKTCPNFSISSLRAYMQYIKATELSLIT